MKDYFVPDYTSLDVILYPRVAAVHGLVAPPLSIGERHDNIGKKTEEEEEKKHLFFSLWLKNNWITFRIALCNDSSLKQEKIEHIIIARSTND